MLMAVAPSSGRRVLRTKPPPFAVPGGHLAAVDLDPLADADEAVAEAVARPSARAVVAHLDLQLVGPVAEGHVGVAGARVLERVGQALLDDPVGGEVDAPRQRTGSPSTCSCTGRPGAADLLEQRVEAVEAGLRRELGVVAVAAHRAEQAAHLRERRAAGLLDALERLAVLGERLGAACAGRRRPEAPSR